MILDNYIKQDFVKEEFMKSCLIVSDILQAESLAKTPYIYPLNIIFELSYLKIAFFNKLKIYHPEIKIISYDASKTRLLLDIKSVSNQFVIFDKVNYCQDFDIFNMINKMNRILIC